MEAPVGDNFRKRVVQHDRFMGEAAANRAIVSGGYHIKQIAQLRHNLHKITVHRKNVAPCTGGVAVPKRSPYSIGRLAIQQFYTRFKDGDFSRHCCGIVGTVVIHDDNFMNIVAIGLDKLFRERAYIHLLVVARNHHRNRPKQFSMPREANARAPCFLVAWFPSPDENGSAQMADDWSMLENKCDRLNGPDQGTRGQRGNNVERRNFYI